MTKKKKRHRKKKSQKKIPETKVVVKPKPKDKLKDMDIHQSMAYYSELADEKSKQNLNQEIEKRPTMSLEEIIYNLSLFRKIKSEIDKSYS